MVDEPKIGHKPNCPETALLSKEFLVALSHCVAAELSPVQIAAVVELIGASQGLCHAVDTPGLAARSREIATVIRDQPTDFY